MMEERLTPLTRRSVVGNILALFSGTALSQFAVALTLFLTARALGVAQFGQYAACFALAKMTAVLFNIGMDTWLLREGRMGHTALGVLVGTNLTAKAGLGAVWFLGLLAISTLLPRDTYPFALLALAALASWLEAAFNTVVFAFNTALENRATAVLTSLSGLALLGITLVFIATGESSPYSYVQARLGIAGISAAGGLAWFGYGRRMRASWSTWRRTRGELAPYALSEALLLVYTQADITILALLLGKVAAGIYSPASSIVRSLFVVPQAVHLVMVPVLSQMLAEGRRSLMPTFRRTYLSLSALGGALWLGMGLFGPPLVLLLLGEDFAPSAGLLPVLSAILFLKSVSHAMAALIVTVGYQAKRVVVQAIVAALNVGVNLWFIPRLGVPGAAWAYVVSEAALLVGYIALVEVWRHRQARLKPEVS